MPHDARMPSIHIVKAGKHTDSHGAVVEFTHADFAASAAAYDPAVHEAPIVIGHPKHDHPAYGWVSKLDARDGDLSAVPSQVDPAFADLVERGAFKKVSASFYTPTSPNNPVPGVWYLRHVGFLGAQPPAIKGLRPVELGEADEGVVTFGDFADEQNASLWRQLREWIIGKFGLDEADKVIPGYQVGAVEAAARTPTDTPTDTPAAINYQEEPDMPQPNDLAAQQAALKEQQDALNAQQAQFAEREQRLKADEARMRRAHNEAVLDALVADGRFLPTHKLGALAFMESISAGTGVVEFGEGEAAVKQSAGEWFAAYLKAQPKVVEFDEVARPQAASTPQEFKAPAGFAVDAANMELHHKALDYAEQNKTDYLTAVRAVSP